MAELKIHWAGPDGVMCVVHPSLADWGGSGPGDYQPGTWGVVFFADRFFATRAAITIAPDTATCNT